MTSDLIGILAGTAMFALMFLIYFIPGFVASRRRHPSVTAIWLVNVFLGWSVAGWLAALVWALNSPAASPRS